MAFIRGHELFLAILVLVCVAFGGTPQAWAKGKKKAKSASSKSASTSTDEDFVPLSQPAPIDTLQERIYRLHRSEAARKVESAYEALQDEKFPEAIKLATPIENNPRFSDYGFWIHATALRKQAADAFEKKQYSDVARLAQKAIDLSMKIETLDPFSPHLKNLYREVAQAESLLAGAYWGQNKWAKAKDAATRAFTRWLAHGELSQVDDDDVLHYADACAKQKDELCTAWIQRFAAQYPAGSDELDQLAKLFPDRVNKARPSFPATRTTQLYKAPDLDQVAFETAIALFLTEKYDAATKAFHQFLDDFPKSAHRYRARYWLARAMQKTGDKDKAQKMLDELQKDSPLTYYGLLSAIEVGKNIDASIDGQLPVAIDNDPFLLPHEVFHLRRAEAFVAEHAYGLAAFELRNFKARDSVSSPFLMYLALLGSEARIFPVSFKVLGDLIQRGTDGVYTSYGLRLIFPVEYSDIIEKNAAEYKLDPILVLSLIKQESAFDEGAMSGSGAMGLMQLMPNTASDMIAHVDHDDLATAAINIQAGTKYLRQLMTRFNDNIVYSLAAYNAGPHAVDRWIKENPANRGMLEFIEMIPYKETREYVSSIIRNYFWYSKKLTNNPPKSLAYFWPVYGPPEHPGDTGRSPSLTKSATKAAAH